jgi:hypothetical protein
VTGDFVDGLVGRLLEKLEDGKMGSQAADEGSQVAGAVNTSGREGRD